MHFVLALLKLTIPRLVKLGKSRIQGPRIWTDASCSDDLDGTPICKLCAIIAPPVPGVPFGIVTTVPKATLATFKDRKQQIHMGELLAPICGLLHWTRIVRDCSCISYIDNMGVLCNIVNGAAKQIDAGALTWALCLRLARLNTSMWWEWVESASNCSDGGSRVGISCPVAKSLGIQLKEVPFPVLPENFMYASPEQWEHFWQEQTRS